MKQANLLSIILSIVGCITGSPVLLPSTGSVLFPGVSHLDDNNGFKPTSKQSGVSDTRVLRPLLPPVLSLNTHPEQHRKNLVRPTAAQEKLTGAGKKTTMSDCQVSVMHTCIWITNSSSASTFLYTLNELQLNHQGYHKR